MLITMWWKWLAVFALAACVDGCDNMQPHPILPNMYYAQKSCAPGLHFSAVTGRCGPPSQANCCGQNPGPDAYTQLLSQLLLTYAHSTDCALFYLLSVCAPGLWFNPSICCCDFPCNSDCPPLMPAYGLTISPIECITGNIKEGGSCNFTCAPGLQLKGSDTLVCSKSGWNSTQGLNVIPICLAPTDVAVDITNNVIEIIGGLNVSFLFVVDQSGSITQEHFPKVMRFAKALVSAFPLSDRRSAGLILFNDKASVEITVSTINTCIFLKQVDKLTYHFGGTDIILALKTANHEIAIHGIHKKSIVFLITDGKGADPTSEANALKQNGNIFFTIGIAGYDRKILESIASENKAGGKLFFGIRDFTAFEEMVKQFEAKFLNGTKFNCMGS